jgi:hypothetical protein
MSAHCSHRTRVTRRTIRISTGITKLPAILSVYCQIYFPSGVHEEYGILGYNSSEEYIASIFRVEEQAKEETSRSRRQAK